MAGLGGPAAGGTVPVGLWAAGVAVFMLLFLWFFSWFKVPFSDGVESGQCLIVLEP